MHLKAIAKALKENRTLKTLALRGNNIGVEGARAIADTLNENKELVNLRLGANNIGHEGMKMIAVNLRKNRPLLGWLDRWLVPVLAVLAGWLLKRCILG